MSDLATPFGPAPPTRANTEAAGWLGVAVGTRETETETETENAPIRNRPPAQRERRRARAASPPAAPVARAASSADMTSAAPTSRATRTPFDARTVSVASRGIGRAAAPPNRARTHRRNPPRRRRRCARRAARPATRSPLRGRRRRRPRRRAGRPPGRFEEGVRSDGSWRVVIPGKRGSGGRRQLCSSGARAKVKAKHESTRESAPPRSALSRVSFASSRG